VFYPPLELTLRRPSNATNSYWVGTNESELFNQNLTPFCTWVLGVDVVVELFFDPGRWSWGT